MIRLIAVLFLLTSTSVLGQLRLEKIKTSQTSNARVEAPIPNQLKLPFWDDFSGGSHLPDTSLWQFGQDVFLNNSLAIGAPSMGVATFDGLNELGQAHNSSATFNGAGDSLVTHPIDLSTIIITQRNTVFLSFFWELKGNGEIPEENDSLSLYFLTIDQNWVQIDINDNRETYSIIGGEENISPGEELFNQVIVPVNRPEYYHQGFRFKFVSHGNLTGAYDTWHLDYVYLNENRSSRDRDIQDRTFGISPSPIFAPYSVIPLKHYIYSDQVYSASKTTINNLEDQPHAVTPVHVLTNLTNGKSISTELAERSIGSLAYDLEVTGASIERSLFDADEDSSILRSTFYATTGDEFLVEDEQVYETVDLRVNDTIQTDILLHDYYAYDDGIADYAIGVNIISGMLAVRYTLTSDSSKVLKAIDINFPYIDPPSEGASMNIIVWKNLEYDVRYAELPYSVINTNRNEFTRIKLPNTFNAPDTFYIGYEQHTEDYIGIGFDKNNLDGSSAIYSNTNREWIQNDRLLGSAMIRPVFDMDTTMIITSVTEPAPTFPDVYPNPSSGNIFLGDLYETVIIRNTAGKTLLTKKNVDQIDLSEFSNGIYVLTRRKGIHQKTSKLLIGK
ncbi:MAG: T9SS type A sorting domain-containing protein [Cyclobacteriaceae bacterium]